jgi:diguanylate cyclase (GGDEF)-like protein
VRSVPGLPRSVKAWSGAVVVLLLAQGVVSLLIPRGQTLTNSSEAVDWALHIATAFIFVHIAWTSKVRTRTFWRLQAACWGMLLVTNTLWTYYGVVRHEEVPALFVGDILLFLAGVPMFAGLMLQPHREKGHAPLRFVDLPLLVLWWLFLYLFFVTPWQYVVPDVVRYGPNYNFVLLAEDVVAIVLLFLLCAGSTGKWKRFYGSLLGAQTLLAGIAYLTNKAIDTNSYFPGSWYDVVIDAGVTWFALTALLGSGLTPEESREDNSEKPPISWTTLVAMFAVLSIPALAAWALLGPATPPQVTRFRVLVGLATITVMGCLIFVKQRGPAKELARANRVLHEASLTDPLTGCRNRRYFDSTIEADISHGLRCFHDNRDQHRRDLIFYLIDADRFKEVNDQFGHGAGDRVLVEMVGRISAAIRLSDVLVRWGGDEFLVVSRYTDRNEAEALATRLLNAISGRPFAVNEEGHRIPLTCSVGWAAFPWLVTKPDAFTHIEVLGLADRALYEAKQAGRNRAVGMQTTGKMITELRTSETPAEKA